MPRRFVFLVAALVLIAAIAAVGSWLLVEQRNAVSQTARAPAATAAAADVGGTFELVDHTGRTVRDTDYRGRFLLVFFGYTYCPDVCPTAFGKVAVAMDELGELGSRVQPLFITIDPERDTPDELGDYVAQFHPAIVGLTGTPAQIAAVAKAYRAFYRKVVPEGSDEADYLMDHSAYLYLMAPDGGFLRVFSHTQGPDEIAAGIREAVLASG